MGKKVVKITRADGVTQGYHVGVTETPPTVNVPAVRNSAPETQTSAPDFTLMSNIIAEKNPLSPTDDVSPAERALASAEQDLVEARGKHDTAKIALATAGERVPKTRYPYPEGHREVYQEWLNDYQDAGVAFTEAERSYGRSLSAYEKAQADSREWNARVKANVPSDAVPLKLSNYGKFDSPKMVRYADGTTNVWVYQYRSVNSNEITTRYVPIVDVRLPENKNEGSVLIAASGNEVSNESYLSGRQIGVQDFNIVIAPPKENGTLLLEEYDGSGFLKEPRYLYTD
jgi:hypothetical protein